MARRKYEFKRGDRVLDSYIKFLKDLEPIGDKKRYFIGQCMKCDLIKRFRLDHITSGKVKTCGCGWREAVADGSLTAKSVRVRQDNPYLQRGGKHWNSGLYLYIDAKSVDVFGDLTLREVMEL
jgi:hypothetical protein